MKEGTLKVIGSSSSGNGYILECGDETLVIELGCRFSDYNQNTRMSRVAGCIVSHIHGDHFNYNTFKRFKELYIDVYSNEDVCNSIQGVKLAKKGEITHIGGFSIQPIPVKHSVENYGYLIKHKNVGKIVFITDLCEFNYNIKNVNHWLIEANYDGLKIIDNVLTGSETMSRFSNHLSIGQAEEIISRNKCSSTQNIILIHLSSENSNENDFIERIKKASGIRNVFVADKDKTFTLSECEF